MPRLDRDYLKQYPAQLVNALARVAEELEPEVYVSGGSVRDWLLGKEPVDLDLTVPAKAQECAALLARILKAAYVPLDEEQDVARVVWHGYVIDYSAFRLGAQSITEDLALRDFTINALAVRIDVTNQSLFAPFEIIDPTNGLDDLHNRLICPTVETVFDDDPLRLLRAYRFMAVLDFSLSVDVREAVKSKGQLLSKVSAERINYELQLIMASPAPQFVYSDMAQTGLLWLVLPELRDSVDLAQPPSHHLDVWQHSLATLQGMVKLQADPTSYFPACAAELVAYLGREKRKLWLRWAALLHDLGKITTHKIREGRITFYNHDQAGARFVADIAERLRWSNEAGQQISRFIANHMWPFHLNNARNRDGNVTKRACLRLARAMDDELSGLFLLAMADSLAGQGPERPADMEEKLAQLYDEVSLVYQEHIRPVLENPPLLTGHDLIDELALEPGPVFKAILDDLQAVQVDGVVTTREEALAWVRQYLAKGKMI